MNDHFSSSNQNPRRQKGWGKMTYLMIAMVQMPLALLIFDTNRLGKLIVEPTADHHWKAYEIVVGFIMVACCIFAGIGLVNGFRKRTVGTMIGGTMVGLVLVALEFFMAVFIGCCIGLSMHTHY